MVCLPRNAAGGKPLIPRTPLHHWSASLLSHLRLCNSIPTAADLVEDNVGSGLPYEGLGFVVPGGEPEVAGMLPLLDAAKSASPNHAGGDEAEPAFDLIEP